MIGLRRNLYVSDDQITWSQDAYQEQYEDILRAWLSFDEGTTYEEDVLLKTEDPEEEDEECDEQRIPGMSTVSVNKLQILWDHFIHAEPQSYEVLIFEINVFSIFHCRSFLFYIFIKIVCEFNKTRFNFLFIINLF